MPARLLVAVAAAVAAAAARVFEVVEAVEGVEGIEGGGGGLRCTVEDADVVFEPRPTTPFAELVATEGGLDAVLRRVSVDALVAHANLTFSYSADGFRVLYGGAPLVEATEAAATEADRLQAFPHFSYHRHAFRPRAERAKEAEEKTKGAAPPTSACVFEAAEAVERCVGAPARRVERGLHGRTRRFAASPAGLVAFRVQEAVAFNASRALRLRRLREGRCLRDASKTAVVDVFGVCLPRAGEDAPDCLVLSVHPWDDECGRDVVLGCDALCGIAELHDDARDAWEAAVLRCGLGRPDESV